MSRYLLQYFSRLAFLPLAVLLIAESASASFADLVWVDSSDNTQSIKFAEYDGEEWVFYEEPIYNSDNALTSLALGTNVIGLKTLIWTEQIRAKTVLMSMSANVDSSGKLLWSLPSIFSDEGRENFSASIVHDSNGQGWVFWSETRGNFSDIVVRRSTGGSWGLISPVNAINDVPDNQPHASVTEAGNVIVEWSSFDIAAGLFQMKNREYSISSAFERNAIKLVDIVSPTDVLLPEGMPVGNSKLIHFPQNQIVQSIVLNDVDQ